MTATTYRIGYTLGTGDLDARLPLHLPDYYDSSVATAYDSALVAAATAAIGDGRPLHLPAGTYRIDAAQLPIPAQGQGLRLVGDGIGQTILRATASGSPMLTIGDGGALDAQFVTVSDLTLDANSAALACVQLNGTRFAGFRRIDFLNATDALLDVLGDVPNYFLNAVACRFKSAAVGVRFNGGSAGVGGNSGTIAWSWFGGCSSYAVEIAAGDSNILTDNEFNGGTTTAIYLHGAALNNKVTRNQFDGPTTAVHCADASVQGTIIRDNTGTVNVTDAGTDTRFDDGRFRWSSSGLVISSPTQSTAVSMRVRAPVSASTDVFRVEKSDGSLLARVDQFGNIEGEGAVNAHARSIFKNDVGQNSNVVTIENDATATATGLVIKGASGQSGDLLQVQKNDGTVLASIAGGTGAIATPAITLNGTGLAPLIAAADTTLHFHAADRARANHTGTQAFSTLTGGTATGSGYTLPDLTVTGVLTNNINVVTKSAAATLTASDQYVRANATSAAFTLTLPTAVGNTGLTFTIKKIDSSANAVTVDGNGSETIDGAATQSLASQYNSLTVVSNGTGWDLL